MTNRNAECTEPAALSRQALDQARGGTTALRAAKRDGNNSAAASTSSGENLYVSGADPALWY